jgi:hypothetical protein
MRGGRSPGRAAEISGSPGLQERRSKRKEATGHARFPRKKISKKNSPKGWGVHFGKTKSLSPKIPYIWPKFPLNPFLIPENDKNKRG